METLEYFQSIFLLHVDNITVILNYLDVVQGCCNNGQLIGQQPFISPCEIDFCQWTTNTKKGSCVCPYVTIKDLQD